MRKKTDEDIEVRKEIANRFNQLFAELRERGISLSELASKLGITENTLMLYKTAKAFPSPRVLKLLGSVFRINLNWLLTGEDDDMFLDIPPNYTLKEKKYFVGKMLREIMDYFKLDFFRLYELIPLEAPRDLIDVLNDKTALPESVLKVITFSFALRKDWYKQRDFLRFNTKNVLLTEMFMKAERLIKDVHTIFASECSLDDDYLNFAVWLKKGILGGVLLYDKLDYLSDSLFCSLKETLLDSASQQGVYFKLLDKETFNKLINGFIHPAKTEGLPLEFPFLHLLREKPLPKIDYKQYLGTPYYGLAKFLYLLSECK